MMEGKHLERLTTYFRYEFFRNEEVEESTASEGEKEIATASEATILRSSGMDWIEPM